MEHITLYFRQGSSDKIYQASIVPKDGGYVVQFQYGRRGSALQSGQKNPLPVPNTQNAHRLTASGRFRSIARLSFPAGRRTGRAQTRPARSADRPARRVERGLADRDRARADLEHPYRETEV